MANWDPAGLPIRLVIAAVCSSATADCPSAAPDCPRQARERNFPERSRLPRRKRAAAGAAGSGGADVRARVRESSIVVRIERRGREGLGGALGVGLRDAD